jgi:hypothetical protein
MVEEDGQLHTLGLLEQLRDQCKSLWGVCRQNISDIRSAI